MQFDILAGRILKDSQDVKRFWHAKTLKSATKRHPKARRCALHSQLGMLFQALAAMPATASRNVAV
jgi:hypothetical protein